MMNADLFDLSLQNNKIKTDLFRTTEKIKNFLDYNEKIVQICLLSE